MSDLEKLIRGKLTSGATSEDVAQEFTRILDEIEKEKTRKAKEAEQEEANKKAAVEAAAKDKLYAELVKEFDNHWTKTPNDLVARDAALVAFMVAMKDPANKDWTKEDMAQFVKDMTDTIEVGLEVHKNCCGKEKAVEDALRMLNEDFGDIIEEIKSRFKARNKDGYPLRAIDRRMTGQNDFEDWLKRIGW